MDGNLMVSRNALHEISNPALKAKIFHGQIDSQKITFSDKVKMMFQNLWQNKACQVLAGAALVIAGMVVIGLELWAGGVTIPFTHQATFSMIAVGGAMILGALIDGKTTVNKDINHAQLYQQTGAYNRNNERNGLSSQFVEHQNNSQTDEIPNGDGMIDEYPDEPDSTQAKKPSFISKAWTKTKDVFYQSDETQTLTVPDETDTGKLLTSNNRTSGGSSSSGAQETAWSNKQNPNLVNRKRNGQPQNRTLPNPGATATTSTSTSTSTSTTMTQPHTRTNPNPNSKIYPYAHSQSNPDGSNKNLSNVPIHKAPDKSHSSNDTNDDGLASTTSPSGEPLHGSND